MTTPCLNSNILIYQTENGDTKIETRLEDETVWLTQAQLCDLFQKSKATISEHIKHVFEEAELEASSVVRNFRTTAILSLTLPDPIYSRFIELCT